MSNITTLIGQLIKNTFRSLIRVTESNGLTGSLSQVRDGAGNTAPLQLSTTEVYCTNLTVTAGTLAGITHAVIDNIEIDGNSVLSTTGQISFPSASILVSEVSAPSTPASGYVAIYAKSDGKLYIKDDAGTETDLSASGYTDEEAQDTVATMIQNGTGITWSYDDGLGTLTPTVTITQYTDELAQDAIGGILLDSTTIDFTYDDVTPNITASVKADSITSTHIDGTDATNIKTELSLNNVENTALSTWAGSTNITTLGTIVTGTWQGSAISASYIADAYLLNNGDVGTGVYDFGGATSFEIPNGTNPTVNVAGQLALDTDGDGSTITSGVLKVYDGTNTLYAVLADGYPASDNDVPAYDSATHTVKWQAQSGSGGGISNVVEDTSPQLGGDLDLNGNQITSPDGTDYIDIPNGSIDLRTNSTSRLDISDSGVRLGGANARVTTILDEDNMASNSDTSLATQQSIKAYVDTTVAGYQPLDTDLTTLSTAFTTASASGAASLKFHEDTDNGTNAVTLQGPASTADVTITLPASSGTLALTSDLSSYQPLDSTLTSLAAYSTNGLLTQTSADTFTGRTITGTSNEISVSNGDGVSGNPTLSLPATIDLGDKTSLEIPNSAAPTVNADGEIAVDTTVTDFSHGILKYYGGEEMAVVAMPVAQLSSPTNNYVVTYDSTADEFQLKAASGGSGISAGKAIALALLMR